MGVYNICVNQGENFDLTATLKDCNGNYINLSGYSVRGKVRTSYGATGVLLNLEPSIFNPISGVIRISLTPAETESLPVTIGVYDLERYLDETHVYRVLNGTFTINPEVTK